MLLREDVEACRYCSLEDAVSSAVVELILLQVKRRYEINLDRMPDAVENVRKGE